MTDWLFTWKSLVVGTAIVIGGLIVGIVFRDTTLGNIAGVVGLAVSVLGFVVTIWTIHDARQQIKQASESANRAIAQAREETRRSVDGIAAQLLAADCAQLRSGIEDLRQAAQDAKWQRSAYRCQDCRVVAYRLAHSHRLTADETSKLRAAADDLLLIQGFIERNRLSGQPGILQKSHVDSLDIIIGLLASIQARLHNEPLKIATISG